MISFPRVAWQVEFNGFGRYIISKLSGYNVFLFLYEALYLFVRLQFALTLLWTRPQRPIVRLFLAFSKRKI